jgi:hypothetical protein
MGGTTKRTPCEEMLRSLPHPCKRGEDDGGEKDGNQAHLPVYESGAAPGPAESQAFHIN